MSVNVVNDKRYNWEAKIIEEYEIIFNGLIWYNNVSYSGSKACDMLCQIFNSNGGKDLNEAKSFLEGQMALKVEDSQEHADLLSLFEEAGDYKGFASYIKNIRKVTKNDIKKAVSKYLNKNYTKVILI